MTIHELCVYSGLTLQLCWPIRVQPTNKTTSEKITNLKHSTQSLSHNYSVLSCNNIPEVSCSYSEIISHIEASWGFPSHGGTPKSSNSWNTPWLRNLKPMVTTSNPLWLKKPPYCFLGKPWKTMENCSLLLAKAHGCQEMHPGAQSWWTPWWIYVT